MKLSRADHKQWLSPELSPAEINALWGQIAERVALAPTTGWGRSWWIAAAAVSLLALGGAFVYRGVGEPSWVGQTVNAPDRGNHTLQLPDGSWVELHANAKLRFQRFDKATLKLELVSGEAEFDVAHVEGRTFAVAAGGVEVVVVGTRFRVRVPELGQEGGVEVVVERGRVRVLRARGQGEVVLQARERWSSPVGVPDAATQRNPVELEVAASALPSSEAPLPPVGAGAPVRTLAARSVASEQSPAKIFEAANRARVSGNSREGARLFSKLLREHRSDSRAALSAFELGRLRLDELGDAKGAAGALGDALALGLSGSLRDDARARLVEAHERSGNVSACRRTREAYLTSMPGGTHRTVVSRRCRAD